MRKALIVGVDFYEHGDNLHGCVNDSYTVKSVLERNSDGSINFSIQHLVASDENSKLRRSILKDSISDLFSGDSEIALFYFAGHGHIENTGGYLLASDASRGDEGLALNEIMTIINSSKAKNKILILDSCHSGIAAARPLGTVSEISEGVTILTSSSKEQYSEESHGKGIFTGLLVDSMNGAAANLVGDITPGSVYAHIDQALGPWQQRPIFKTNVSRFISLRRVQPPISLESLQKIAVFFPIVGFEFKLDPSHEPGLEGRQEGDPLPDKDKTEVFKVLQQYNRVNLLVPLDAPHMWHAAMGYKSCKLTALGEHYRKLVEEKKI